MSATKELRYELVQSLIPGYVVPYYRIRMENSVFFYVTIRDV